MESAAIWRQINKNSTDESTQKQIQWNKYVFFCNSSSYVYKNSQTSEKKHAKFKIMELTTS